MGDKLDFFSFHASGRYYAFLLAVIVSVSLSYITLNSFLIDNLSIYRRILLKLGMFDSRHSMCNIIYLRRQEELNKLVVSVLILISI